ncbi:MAG: hypothetical protein HOH73_06550, partial [Alphaproteobacteria bacterium]|nr:hypothetical protein [Alphaproteobacteria bacterium]
MRGKLSEKQKHLARYKQLCEALTKELTKTPPTIVFDNTIFTNSFKYDGKDFTVIQVLEIAAKNYDIVITLTDTPSVTEAKEQMTVLLEKFYLAVKDNEELCNKIFAENKNPNLKAYFKLEKELKELQVDTTAEEDGSRNGTQQEPKLDARNGKSAEKDEVPATLVNKDPNKVRVALNNSRTKPTTDLDLNTVAKLAIAKPWQLLEVINEDIFLKRSDSLAFSRIGYNSVIAKARKDVDTKNTANKDVPEFLGLYDELRKIRKPLGGTVRNLYKTLTWDEAGFHIAKIKFNKEFTGEKASVLDEENLNKFLSECKDLQINLEDALGAIIAGKSELEQSLKTKEGFDIDVYLNQEVQKIKLINKNNDPSINDGTREILKFQLKGKDLDGFQELILKNSENLDIIADMLLKGELGTEQGAIVARKQAIKELVQLRFETVREVKEIIGQEGDSSHIEFGKFLKGKNENEIASIKQILENIQQGGSDKRHIDLKDFDLILAKTDGKIIKNRSKYYFGTFPFRDEESFGVSSYSITSAVSLVKLKEEELLKKDTAEVSSDEGTEQQQNQQQQSTTTNSNLNIGIKMTGNVQNGAEIYKKIQSVKKASDATLAKVSALATSLNAEGGIDDLKAYLSEHTVATQARVGTSQEQSQLVKAVARIADLRKAYPATEFAIFDEIIGVDAQGKTLTDVSLQGKAFIDEVEAIKELNESISRGKAIYNSTTRVMGPRIFPDLEGGITLAKPTTMNGKLTDENAIKDVTSYLLSQGAEALATVISFMDKAIQVEAVRGDAGADLNYLKVLTDKLEIEQLLQGNVILDAKKVREATFVEGRDSAKQLKDAIDLVEKVNTGADHYKTASDVNVNLKDKRDNIELFREYATEGARGEFIAKLTDLKGDGATKLDTISAIIEMVEPVKPEVAAANTEQPIKPPKPLGLKPTIVKKMDADQIKQLTLNFINIAKNVD